MIDAAQLIETCKQDIAHAAIQAGLDWRQEDIVSVHEDGFGDVVFLRRFNPREAVDENGDVIIRDGKPIIVWSNTMWAEYRENQPRIVWEGTNGDRITCNTQNYTFRVNVPRLICAAPWLVRIVAPDGKIKGRSA
jgi:hypothetical protein